MKFNNYPELKYFARLSKKDLRKEVIEVICFLIVATIMVLIPVFGMSNSSEGNLLHYFFSFFAGSFGVLVLYFIPINYLTVLLYVFKRR